ncbi:MAG: HYExAFE family protein [Phycisphaerae bacterium]|nr:HYExAFE family protein [Phycisphaerae bacterium]
MKRSNHYEAAFEHLLRERALPYVAVDEAKRALLANTQLKSFDFVLYLPERRNLLIDVKGRKAAGGKRRWSFDPWVNRSDLEALATWQEVFGDGFRAAFAFAFWLSDLDQVGLFETFTFRERYYRFYVVYLDDYRPYLRQRSDRWDTVTIPREVFGRLAFEFDELLRCPPANKKL